MNNASVIIEVCRKNQVSIFSLSFSYKSCGESFLREVGLGLGELNSSYEISGLRLDNVWACPTNVKDSLMVLKSFRESFTSLDSEYVRKLMKSIILACRNNTDLPLQIQTTARLLTRATKPIYSILDENMKICNGTVLVW